MTHGIFPWVAATVAILVAVLVLAVLISLVFLRTDDPTERYPVALFWTCLAVTWLLAVVAAVAILSTTQST